MNTRCDLARAALVLAISDVVTKFQLCGMAKSADVAKESAKTTLVLVLVETRLLSTFFTNPPKFYSKLGGNVF